MAMYPNGRYMSSSPGRHFGVAPGLDVYLRGRNDRFNQHASGTRLKTASSPDGYDVEGLVPAMRAGSMAALTPFADATFTGALLQGGPMVGSGSIDWTTPGGSLSLTTSLTGSATLTFTGNASVLRLVIGMDGTGSISLTGAGGLSLIVPFDGSGSFGIAGAGDLRGRLSMDGSWTPFSELSPEGLAAAVWGAVAATNNDAGTMGNKLNSAASGGVDYSALADAVRTELGVELSRILELAQIHGLVIGVDLTVTPTSRSAGDITQVIASDAVGTTVTRTS